MSSVFKLWVEVGRVCFFNSGADKAKIVTIVAIIDQNRVLVDGPTSGISRKEVTLNTLDLTQLKVASCPNGCTTSELEKLLKEQKVDEQWKNTTPYKKFVQKQTRESLNDFSRYQVEQLKKQKNTLVQAELKTVTEEFEKKEKTRLAPHLESVAKIEKRKALVSAKKFKRLSRKITKRGLAAAAEKKKERVEKYLKEHPEHVKKVVEKKKKVKTDNTSRPRKTKAEREKRWAAGAQKLAQKK
eukprot:gene11918-5323_t